MMNVTLIARACSRTMLLLSLLIPSAAWAQSPDSARAFHYTAAQCPSCADWLAPHPQVRIFGNTWYVGTNGLSAILITSPQGHILIDAGLPESARMETRTLIDAGACKRFAATAREVLAKRVASERKAQ